MPTTAVHHADCLDVIRDMDTNSVDTIITDPPYGLSATRPDKVSEAIAAWASGDREHMPHGRGFMGASWDAFVPPPALWDECLRVLKPGGHLASFAGARTYDLMGLSIRLAGFEIRDGLSWIYGSGMAHGQNIGKTLAKEAGDDRGWSGWNTGLKPAQEPIVLARKPLAETSAAANMVTQGTGALHVDACRIEHRSAADLAESMNKNRHRAFGTKPGRNRVYGDFEMVDSQDYDGTDGRYPANVVLSHSPDCEMVGVTSVRSDSHHPAMRPAGGIGLVGHSGQSGLVERTPDAEAVEDWDCAPGCPVAEVDAQSGGLAGIGGASRFFLTSQVPFAYSAKAGPKERPVIVRDDGTEIRHVSVKPLKVMRWLVRLLTPPGGLILDPFAGSVTTLEAAVLEGFDVVGVEREADYVELIKQRLARTEADAA